VRLSFDILCQDMSVSFWLGQVRSGYDRLGKCESRYIRLGQVIPGNFRLVQVRSVYLN